MRKKKHPQGHDTSMQLLEAYRFNNTYIRVLESEKLDRILVQVTDNPRYWYACNGREEYRDFRPLRRLEIGCSRLSISHVNHQQFISTRGPLLGIRIPVKNTEITPADENNGIHEFETSMEYREKILRGLCRLLAISPQQKIDIIEESITSFMK